MLIWSSKTKKILKATMDCINANMGRCIQTTFEEVVLRGRHVADLAAAPFALARRDILPRYCL